MENRKKKIQITGIILILAGVIIAGSWFAIRQIEGKEKHPQETYEKLTSMEAFLEIENGFVYFGKGSCEHCQLFRPILTGLLQENESWIYEFDTGYIRKETDITEEALLEFFEEYDIRGVPMLIEIREGKMTDAAHISKFKKTELEEMEKAAKVFLRKNETKSKS